MKVKEIHYNENFQKMFRKLPKKIQEKACRAEALFRNSPFYPIGKGTAKPGHTHYFSNWRPDRSGHPPY